jgi:hypothetical protein
MSKKRKTNEELTPEELEEQNAEQLPERSAMMLVQPPHIYSSPPVPTDGDGLSSDVPPVDPTNA